MRIAIIGGGIAGLAATYELEKGRASGSHVEYTLFESRERLGGSLASEIANGIVLERGPDSFLSEPSSFPRRSPDSSALQRKFAWRSSCFTRLARSATTNP